jgi:hypothetical protein
MKKKYMRNCNWMTKLKKKTSIKRIRMKLEIKRMRIEIKKKKHTRNCNWRTKLKKNFYKWKRMK